ncbi:MAG: extracellular solute-binding protein, partial [Anaerolineae bacterium]|nr:extracellular solute-binding protein [Anaerolineae bacterium]
MSSNLRWLRIVGTIVVLAMVLAACGPAATPTEEVAPPTEAPPTEVPPTAVPPEEKVTITWATIAGFYTDWAEEVAKEFEAKTGYDVEVVDIDFSQLYEKQVIEMVGKTGAYDIITYDVGWKAEFANSGYLLPLDDYIAASDPEEIQFEDIHPALIEGSCRWKGQVWGLPFYTFTMGYFYRCDLFEDPGEMAAFEANYGYPLDVPQTYEQMADIAEFFHRQPGDTLKGETIDEEFYGIGLMAGRFPHVQDEMMSIAWTWDQDLIKDDGTPGTTEPKFLDAVHLYVDELLPHAPPGALTSAYDEVVGQMRQGLIAQTAAFYLDQWPNMVKTEDCAATSPGAHTWVGALTLAMTADGKHPDQTWEFLKWITGPEAQRKFAEGGGSTCRVSILTDEEFLEGRRLAAGHFPPLMEVLDHEAECNFYPNYYY